MNRPIIFCRCALVALLLSSMLGFTILAQAQNRSRFTAGEIARLPEYCQDKMNGNRNKKKWESYFGTDNWRPFHHYCIGLIFFSRAATEIDPQRRGSAARDGIDDFNYVLRAWPASFQFYPQAEMYKQQLEMIKKWK